MAQLSEHPSVKHFYEEKAKQGEAPTNQVLDTAWLRQLCLDAGADDVGFVERDRPEIADQKAEIENVFPRTRTLISVVCRMNRENIRTRSPQGSWWALPIRSLLDFLTSMKDGLQAFWLWVRSQR